MRVFNLSGLTVLLYLGACSVERTPQSYIDQIDTPAAEIEASREELSDRLLSSGLAAQRRDTPALTATLVPLPGVQVLGLGEEADTASGAAVRELVAMAAGGRVAMTEPVVSVSPGNDVSWFSTAFQITRPEEISVVRFTGVFVRQEGEWRLAQAHLSEPFRSPESPSNPAPEEARDTAAAGG